jgi:Tol biopolymer transport system component
MAYGLPWVGRLIFGKYVSMNAYTPTWVTEGLAVYEETVSSGAGRGRSSYVEMILRMAALEDKFPSIDRGYRAYPEWPFGSVAYYFGGRFQLWLAERYGEEALLRYHRDFATDPIPYFLWLPSEIVFDASMESLWSTWQNEVKQDAYLTVARVTTSSQGITVPKRLTRYGGDLIGPQVTPDGKRIIFSTFSPVDGPRLRSIAMDGSDDTILVNDTLSKAISFTPKGDAFYFQQANINQRFYLHNSLFRYDLAKGTAGIVQVDPAEERGFVAPSGSMRARDPDVAPDGKHLVFVQTPYGSNQLVYAVVESDGTTVHPHILVPAEPDVELANPRFSPDGRLIAVSRFKGGRRDVIIYDLQGRIFEEVTRDRAQDVDPTWTKDGHWLIFSSDRTGIYNLYAYELETKRLRRLTNLIGGAFQPCLSPDGKTVVYRGYSADGYDVYSIPFEPEYGIEVPDEKEPPEDFDMTPRHWPPLRDDLPKIPPPAPFTGAPLPERLQADWSIGQYSSLDTVLPFHDNWNLYPSIFANEREYYLSLFHYGQDAMGTQSYGVEADYYSLSKFLGGTVVYSNDQFEPTFTFLGSALAKVYSGAFYVPQTDPNGCPFGDRPATQRSTGRTFCFGRDNGDYHERRLDGAFAISLPFLQRHLFSMGYTFEKRDSLDPVPADSLILASPGRYAGVTAGYAYGFTHAFPYSISPERGWTFGIGVRALSKGLGSNYEEVVVTSETHGFLSMPSTISIVQNHVLAARFAVGVAGGPDLADTFQLGGLTSISPITNTTANFYGLRGVQSGSLNGKGGLLLGTLEYRAPLYRVDHGPGTLPATLGALHAAVFCDTGRVFDKVNADAVKHDLFGPFAVSFGAELRADFEFFYSLPLTLVGGIAYAAHVPDNNPRVAANGPYVRLGATF